MPRSVEEQRQRNAAKQRAYRARRRAEREAAREAGAGNAGDAPTTMHDAVEEALGHMQWLKPSDAASKAQARELARQIDTLVHQGDTTKALSAHRALSRVLSDLGGTPLVRMQRELRSSKRKPEDDDGGNQSAETPPGNVTQFPRPARRRS